MKRILFTMFGLLVLAACNQNEAFVFEDHSATHIDILDRETDELRGNVQDSKFAQDLLDQLRKADTVSLANKDLPNPDLTLIFYDENQELVRVGYYELLMNLEGGSGKYRYNGQLYEVKENLDPSLYEAALTLDEVETAVRKQGVTLSEADLPEENVFLQPLNGVSPEAYSIEESHLFIFVFSSEDDRRDGMEAFEEATAAYILESYNIFSARNVLAFYVDGKEAIQNRIQTGLNRLNP